jgi:hypothetical protein
VRKLSNWALGGLLAFTLPAVANAAQIIHTNDILGELEPCGCRSNPLGGMTRMANLLKRISAKDPSLLVLDGGDLLFPTPTIPPLLADQSKLQVRYLLKALDMVHEDAVVPGEKDFALGWKTFESLSKETHIKFLAANLKKKNGGKAFEPYAIFDRKTADGKPIRIGVFGLVDETLTWPKELKASPAFASATAQVKALKAKKVDLIVALTHEGGDKDQELAQKVPGIDMIIGGHSQSFFQTPITVGSTTIYQSSFRNQYVGVIPVDQAHNKAHTDESGPSNDYKLIGLDAGYDSPTEAPSAMDDLIKEFKTSIAELNSRDEVLTQIEKGDTGHIAKYQTFARCAECHLKQFDFWRKTAHANALAPLMEKDQFLNKECLTCHTVGLGDPEGFSNVKTLAELKKGDDGSEPFDTASLATYLKSMREAPNLDTEVTVGSQKLPLRQSLNLLHHSWTPVQCEDCHMAGADHPFAAGYSKKVENTTCLKCHTPERAPEWYDQKPGQPATPDWKKIASKREMVTCPAGE